MARAPVPAVDPAADAAALLRRLGFATLTLAVPVAAVMTRRAVIVLAPIGVALLVIAAMLDPAHPGFRASLRRMGLSRAGLAGIVVLGWSVLSVAWTPFPGPASSRAVSIVATVAMAVAGYLALPERMRSANLYLIPVGTGLAAFAAIALALLGGATGDTADADGRSLERGLVVLVLFAWPSIAWLRSRERDLEAVILAIVVAVAALLGPQPAPMGALAVGAGVYAVTAASPRVGPKLVAGTMAAVLALAPLLPLVARPIVALTAGTNASAYASVSVWRRVVLDEPLRLLTGHGFETALRGRFVGLLAPNAPNSILFEAWYELGLVGALAGAAALYWAATAAARDHPSLVPGVMAAFGTAFTFACLGIGTAQGWWVTAIAVLVLVFVAAERGQFRTTRPKATLSSRPRAANDA